MNSNTNIMLSLATTLLPADSQSDDRFHSKFPDGWGVAYISGVTQRPSLTKKYISLQPPNFASSTVNELIKGFCLSLRAIRMSKYFARSEWFTIKGTDLNNLRNVIKQKLFNCLKHSSSCLCVAGTKIRPFCAVGKTIC